MSKPAPSALVLNLLQSHPDEVLSPSEIAAETGLSAAQVSAALQHLQRAHPGHVRNEGRGEWTWVDGADLQAPTIEPAATFTALTTREGGVVLRDEKGGIWFAVPMLPATELP